MSDVGNLITVVGSLGGVALGWLGTLVSEKRRDERADAREAAARNAARQQAITDRRESHELSSLGDMYEALTELARASHWVLDDAIEAAGADGTYRGRAAVSKTLADRHREANKQVHILCGLIVDDTTREAVREAHRALNLAFAPLSLTSDDARRIYEESSQPTQVAYDLMATRIRELYQGPVTTS